MLRFTRLIAGSIMNNSDNRTSTPMKIPVRGVSSAVPTAPAATSSRRVRGQPDMVL